MSDQDHGRDLGAPDAPSTAAEAFDPVAFARRVDEARARRTEALARREALGTGSEPHGVAGAAHGTARPPAPERAAPGRRSLAVFCFGLCTGFGAALVAAQVLLQPSRPAPAASFDVAVLPAASGSSRPALPAAAARFAAPVLPEQAPDPRAVAGVDMRTGPLARPADLVLLADTARTTRSTRGSSRTQAGGPGLPPGIPRLVGRVLDEAARTAGGAVRELRRMTPVITARDGRLEIRHRAGARPPPAATRSTRGRGRN